VLFFFFICFRWDCGGKANTGEVQLSKRCAVPGAGEEWGKGAAADEGEGMVGGGVPSLRFVRLSKVHPYVYVYIHVHICMCLCGCVCERVSACVCM
jgi:hypothetical protein